MNEAIGLGRVFANNYFLAIDCYHIFFHCFFPRLFTARTAAIASDLSYALIRRFAAMIAAIFLLRLDQAAAHVMSTFIIVYHVFTPVVS
jgi:hypothetical protein